MDVGKAVRGTELDRLRAEDAQRTATPVRGSQPSTDTSVAISQPADLLKRLSSLRQSEPDKFKLLMEQVSANLRAAANSDRSPVGAQLTQLSKGLARAADTGDLSGLQSLDTPRSASAATPSATQRAIAAYRRNMPTPSEPTNTLKQALDYVRSVVDAETQSEAG